MFDMTSSPWLTIFFSPYDVKPSGVHFYNAHGFENRAPGREDSLLTAKSAFTIGLLLFEKTNNMLVFQPFDKGTLPKIERVSGPDVSYIVVRGRIDEDRRL